MTSSSGDILEAKIAERNDRAKKLYRYVSDVARRIDEGITGCKSVADLFTTYIEVQRQKLRDNCEKLFFLHPEDYGKKSLELLWRKVYYETVSAAKKIRNPDQEYDSYLFTHIVCGIGHFHSFITRLETDMSITFPEMDYLPLCRDDEDEETKAATNLEDLHFGQSVIHSCLIYLGDLSRYHFEMSHSFDPSIAARYYLQAAHVDLNSGMPYNQLGNLYLDRNHNLDSVCYYIHCLNCTNPFDGAMGNLTKIFEKNNQFCEALVSSETLTQTEHVQNTISNFLSLIDIWYMNKGETNIPERCNLIAHELKIALDFSKPVLPDISKNYEEYSQILEEENINPSYFNSNLVHKIVLICLLTLSKMNETNEQKAFACKAFSLALLSQLLQKLLKQLESFGFKNPALKYHEQIAAKRKVQKQDDATVDNISEEPIPTVIITNGNIENTENKLDIKNENHAEDNICNTNTQNGDSKNGPKKLAKRRRRRRVASSESSNSSDDDTGSSDEEHNESCSNEELSDSSFPSDDDSPSDASFDNNSDIEEPEKAEVEKDKNSNNGNENTKTKLNGSAIVEENHLNTQEKPMNGTDESVAELNTQEIQNFFLGDNFLASIKLLQDWVLSEKDLILSCGYSGESLFQCVVDLLNIFTYYFTTKTDEIFNEKTTTLFAYVKSVAKKLKLEYKTIPLPEDINLRGTNICKFDKDAAEWQMLDKYKPTVYEENIIRILNFIDFGNQIAKLVPKIRFNRSMKIFFLKKVSPPKVMTKINHKRSREWHNSKKPHVENTEGGLLRRLGRLWLASRVKELEGSGQMSTALLALDASALHKHLRRVKQLVRGGNCVLLLPSIVLQELDDLKREQSTARDAIRWLETQLRSGSRFVKVQRTGQAKPLPLLKYPRKAPTHVHNFIQILEFCYHFIADEKPNQGGNGDPDHLLQGKSAPLLVLLVGTELGKEEDQYKEFSLTGAAQSAGISVEYIGDFYSKWRQSAHKTGKNR